MGHVVIVGGGITGLSAAFYLQQQSDCQRLPISYTLVEAEPRLGGKIQTERIERPGRLDDSERSDESTPPFLVEAGPDSFLATKPHAVELARELGLAEELIRTNPARHPVYVLVNGTPQPLPEGLSLGVPTRLLTLALSPIITPRGKLRMAADLFLPARRDGGDESLGHFIRRRLGGEALERLVEPLAAGIYSADPEEQSLLATFPQLRWLEQQHGGLIRGMMAARRERPNDQGSPFVTLRQGLGALVERLAGALQGTVTTGRAASRVDRLTEAAQPYRVVLNDGATLSADAVILASPAFAAADLVGSFAPRLAEMLKSIRYVSTANVNLAYHSSEAGSRLQGYGLVVPRSERRSINACTLSSLKFGGRTPEHCLLVRAFVGGSRQPHLVDLEEQALVRLVREELRAVLGIDAQPMLSRVYRWRRANPQYDVGHLERIAAIEALAPQGLFLVGSAYRGVGIPDCIGQGQEAAQRAIDNLTSRKPGADAVQPRGSASRT